MRVIQTAGGARLEVFTDGSPLWFQLDFPDRGIDVPALSRDDLIDLRYCIDRMLAKTEHNI